MKYIIFAKCKGKDKPMDQFVTRLKQKVQPCNFVDIDHEIKDQIVFNSDRVQRKALRNDLALQNLVAVARAMELSNKQAVLIEEKTKNFFITYKNLLNIAISMIKID